jgi:hypothetical protein
MLRCASLAAGLLLLMAAGMPAAMADGAGKGLPYGSAVVAKISCQTYLASVQDSEKYGALKKEALWDCAHLQPVIQAWWDKYAPLTEGGPPLTLRLELKSLDYGSDAARILSPAGGGEGSLGFHVDYEALGKTIASFDISAKLGSGLTKTGIRGQAFLLLAGHSFDGLPQISKEDFSRAMKAKP